MIIAFIHNRFCRHEKLFTIRMNRTSVSFYPVEENMNSAGLGNIAHRWKAASRPRGLIADDCEMTNS